MPNNINISSGSDFSKKKFGSITKLTKPTFVHNGKVFSDHIFNNQQTLPLIEDNIYYTAHGLPDLYQTYELIPFNINNIELQSIFSLLSIYNFSSLSAEYLSNRSDISVANALISSTLGGNPFDPLPGEDPYNTNPDDEQCEAP